MMMTTSTYPISMTNTTNTVTTASATTSSKYHHNLGNLTGISSFSGGMGSTSFSSHQTQPQPRGSLTSSSVGVEGATTTTSSSINQQTPQTTATGGTGTSAPYYNHHFHPPAGHSFLSDVNEVKDMENSLLSLLGAFHDGDLSAFGKGCSLQTMETIRAKQERLAKLHFELGSTKATGTTDSNHQNWMSDEDQNKLVAELRELSLEIEKLHDTSS